VKDSGHEGRILDDINLADSFGWLPLSPPKGWSSNIEHAKFRLGKGRRRNGWVDISCDEPTEVLVALQVALSDDPSRYIVTSLAPVSFQDRDA
jgi:hypothetical protein